MGTFRPAILTKLALFVILGPTLPAAAADWSPAHAEAAVVLSRNFVGKTFFTADKPAMLVRGLALVLEQDIMLVKTEGFCSRLGDDAFAGPSGDEDGAPLTLDSIQDCERNQNGLSWKKTVSRAPLRMVMPDSISLAAGDGDHGHIIWKYDVELPNQRPGFSSIACQTQKECEESLASLKLLVLRAKQLPIGFSQASAPPPQQPPVQERGGMGTASTFWRGNDGLETTERAPERNFRHDAESGRDSEGRALGSRTIRGEPPAYPKR